MHKGLVTAGFSFILFIYLFIFIYFIGGGGGRGETGVVWGWGGGGRTGGQLTGRCDRRQTGQYTQSILTTHNHTV